MIPKAVILSVCVCCLVPGCSQQPSQSSFGFFVCWDVLIPSEGEGNLAAVIIGTPPEDMYVLTPAAVPSNGTLKLFGEHDGAGNIRSLTGFEYTDPDGWRARVVLGESPLNESVPAANSTIYAEIAGLLIQFAVSGDQLSDAVSMDAAGVSWRLDLQDDTKDSCRAFTQSVMHGLSADSLESNLCFVYDALSCISSLAMLTDAPGWGVYGPKRNMAESVTRFAALGCQQVAFVPPRYGAVPVVNENVAGWMTTWSSPADAGIEQKGTRTDAD